MRDQEKRGDLFLKGVMTLALAIAFLFFGGLIVAGFVWGFVNLGAIILPITILLVVVIVIAWGVAGWLLK